MTFRCDRCGATYSTKQELREGRVYQARCQACGNSIRLTMASRPPVTVPRPRPQTSPPPESPAARAQATPQAAGSTSGEITPPPADGYYDLFLDDSEPQHPKDAAVAQAPAPPPSQEPHAPIEPEETARILATAGKPAPKRRMGAGALVAIGAGVVLFGAVGAMALKKPQRDEERVSRALLPRAEWVDSQSAGVQPSPEVLARLEAEEDEPAAADPTPGQPRQRERSPRHAPRPPAAAPAARPVPAPRSVLAVREESVVAPQVVPVPAPPPAAVPPPVAAAPPAAAASPALAAVAPARVEQTEDAPQFARQGFRSPSQETPNCVQSTVRIPRDLQDFVSGPITVRFAVDRDGSVGLFRVEGQVPDRRIAEAIWAAVRECRFVPGADDQGRAVRLWVVMPVRFVR